MKAVENAEAPLMIITLSHSKEPFVGNQRLLLRQTLTKRHLTSFFSVLYSLLFRSIMNYFFEAILVKFRFSSKCTTRIRCHQNQKM